MKDLIAFTHITITTKQRYEILDITDRVEEVHKRARLFDGFVTSTHGCGAGLHKC